MKEGIANEFGGVIPVTVHLFNLGCGSRPLKQALGSVPRV